MCELKNAFSLTAILVSRFLIDLQAANQRVLRLDEDDPLYTSKDDTSDGQGAIAGPDVSLVFAKFDVVGSIGCVLEPEQSALSGTMDLGEDFDTVTAESQDERKLETGPNWPGDIELEAVLPSPVTCSADSPA